MPNDLAPEQHAAVRAALADPAVRLGHGVGTADGERCTIAAIRIALRGTCDDKCDRCMSPVIHRWVVTLQDNLPVDLLNSTAWRGAAVGIAGSVADEATEQARVRLILEWMWGRLADPAVLAALPARARPAWDTMLQQRTRAAAHDAAYAAAYAAAASSRAAAAAADAVDPALTSAASRAATSAAHAANAADDGARAEFWARADPSRLLAKLTALGGPHG